MGEQDQEDLPDSTRLSYWLNWWFFLCAFWIVICMTMAIIILWKYEGPKKSQSEGGQKRVGFLYEDEAWNTSLTRINPTWLLVFRLISFVVLFGILVANGIDAGTDNFFFYTQWTFFLVTVYFGYGTAFSIYGLWRYGNRVGNGGDDHRNLDEEADNRSEISNTHDEPRARKAAGRLGYIFQMVFHVCGGAVTLTDAVFWFLLYPFLTANDYELDYLIVCLHSVNAILLFGDVILSCMRFPMFRIAYFVLWTCVFVIFQWIVHTVSPMWWPYPFLDMDSPFAPLWYFAVGLVHIPVYTFFALLVKLKHWIFRRWLKSYRKFT